MKSRGVVGKRIKAIRQERYYDSRTGRMQVNVLALVLDDETLLIPVGDIDEEGIHRADFIVQKGR